MDGENERISETDGTEGFPSPQPGETNSRHQQEVLDSLETAKEIMGQSAFFGPAEIGSYFDMEQIAAPVMPFSPEELRCASDLGQFLILRLSQDAESNPLTMRRIAEILDPKFRATGIGSSVDTPNYGETRSQDMDPSFSSDVPTSVGRDRHPQSSESTQRVECKWALTASRPIPGSTLTNDERSFLDHAGRLAHYLSEHILASIGDPEDRHRYELALNNPMLSADALKYMSRLSREALSARTQELLSLPVVELCSPTAVQAFYDSAVYRLAGSTSAEDDRMLENEFVWTRSASSSGKIVVEGCYGNPYGLPTGRSGLKIGELDPSSNRYFSPDSDAAGDNHYGHIVGSIFSRTK